MSWLTELFRVLQARLFIYRMRKGFRDAARS